MKKTIVYSVLLGLFCGLPALAAPVRYVAQSGGNDSNTGLTSGSAFATIQKGIDSLVAQEGGAGTVYVASGTYAPIISANLNIRIESLNGRDNTVIDGGGTRRCATLGDTSLSVANSGSQNATVLVGFTLQNGNAVQGAHPASGFGGGVFGGTLINCAVQVSKAAGDGGGAAFAILHDSLLNQNTAAVNGGGAAYSALYTVTLIYNSAVNGGGTHEGSAQDSLMWQNNAVNGGGSHGGVMVGCTYSENFATLNGGGAFGGVLSGGVIAGCEAGDSGGGASDASIYDGCVIADCNAVNGGGIHNSYMENSMLANCHATSGGGSHDSEVVVCDFWNNTAQNGGGAHGGTLRNCTLGGNVASVNGGAMHGGAAYSSYILGNSAVNGNGGGAYGTTLVNSLFNYNTAKNGAGISHSTTYNCTIVNNYIDSSAIAGVVIGVNAAGVSHSTCYNSIVWHNFITGATFAYSNNDANSTFHNCCVMEPPTNGSGNTSDSPNMVNVEVGEFGLQLGSSCINAGNNAYVPAGVLTDMNGNARIQHGTVDIGCEEFSGELSVWVALDARGGTVAVSDLNLVFGGKYDGLADATRRGYDFAGWMLDGVLVTAASDVTAVRNHTLVAQWTAKTVTVHVDLGGAGDTTVYLPFGSVYMHNIPTPIKAGYTFAGWLDVGNDQVFQVTTENTHTVHPAWTAKTVAVQVDLDGDSVADTTVHLPFASAYAAGIAEPVKTGFDFGGWMDGTGATVTTVNNENAHTVYSKWSAAGAPAQFDEDGDIAIPVITGISMDTMKQSVTITVSNCVQSASVYWLEGTDDLTTKFLPLEPTDYETPAEEIRDGIWIIPDIPVNTGLGQFFYKVGVGSRE